MAKKKRKLPHIRLKPVTWIALWLMAFLLPLAWRRVSQPQQTEAAWWNDAWHYRQRVDVTNNTSEEANVYIALTLDTSDTTKFQANCGDLRFTKQNGQLLQYYLVSGCGTASTSIHVQFDTFPAGAQSVYAYYGDAAAADGFASADFSTEASNYTIGGVASEEVGPGPIAYWKFDECEGTVAHDSSGNDNHGTINIGATGSQTTAGTCQTSGAWANGASGKFNGSLNFDGGDDYVDLGASDIGSKLDLTERLTLSAWIKSNKAAGSAHGDIISRDDNSGERQYNIHLTTAGRLRFYMEGSGVNGTSDLNDGQWHHVVATWDKNPGTMTVYVDGVIEGTESRTTSLTSRALSTVVGKRTNSWFFDGQIDDVRIFNYALSPAQVKKVVNEGMAVRYGPTVSNSKTRFSEPDALQ